MYADELLVDIGVEMMVLGSNMLSPWLMFENRGHFNCTRAILKNTTVNFWEYSLVCQIHACEILVEDSLKEYTLIGRWKLQCTLLRWKIEQFLLVAWIAR